MYRTLKIRVKTTSIQKSHLREYEKMYYKELDNLILQFQKHPARTKFRDTLISESIEAHSHWTLYQIGVKMYRRKNENKKASYGKSSSWHPRSIHVHNDKLTLHYGKAFAHRQDTLWMKPEYTELLQLKMHTIVRMDLVHDETFWYANFLIHIDDNHGIE